MYLSKSELHTKALGKSEDSAKIKPSMTVVRVGFVSSMLSEMQEDFKKIIEAKDLEIAQLKEQLENK